jgi:outer membrane lipoprotein-sorting protein
MINKRVLIIVFLLSSCALYSQNTLPKATQVLEKTTRKYNGLSAFSIDFKITTTAMEKNIHSFSGVLFVKKDKYFLTFEDQVMANDGKICWNYQSNSNEATLFEAEDDEFMIFHPIQILNNWSNDYSTKIIREENLQQKMVILVDFTPKEKTNFSKLRLFIDKETSYIKQVIIYDVEGMTITYTVTKFTPNISIPDAKFTFNKNDYPNVQVIDMR